MLELVLIRHGETPWNTGEMFRGQEDVPLSDRGRQQAKLLADYLGGEALNSLYTSPLQRAVATAAPLAQRLGLVPVVSGNLTDIDFGKWQGLTVAEVKSRYPTRYRDWLERPENVVFPGGEGLAAVSDRVIPFLDDLIIKHGPGKAAIVTHRVILKIIVCFLLGVTNAGFWKFRLETASVTRFRVEDGRAVLMTFNDITFLGDYGTATSDF